MLAAAIAPAYPAEDYAGRADVRRFVAEVSERNGLPRAEIEALMARARRQSSVLRAMQAPAEAPQRSWAGYRAQFLTPQRIEAGMRFREANAVALKRAADEFGVPEEIVLGIIGVETVYGRNVGSYRVLDALATLAFDFPARQDYFRYELEQFLLHVREEGLDALAVRGSYAGAIGIPQFMPGSYRRYAVDFDGDGHRNLRSSAADAIGSVANFLRQHGWQPGEPVAVKARAEGNAFKPLLQGGVLPGFRLADLEAVGVTPTESAPAEALSTLIELPTSGQPPVYWLGFTNFFVLTRYNRSSFYAIAVLELARVIAAEARRRDAGISLGPDSALIDFSSTD